ncbi:hypothetical protein DMH12_11300 [Streptomyces sp. WAC 04229]|uniref:nuclear transport factor 2 family protein n=1 Tax=Streptomyces sp. WAC 04229 TaxID=2203206 RepID=UPI000F73D9C2|nr:nuclear transport factor 2 family protein [Streptomyces sp. WAC 04229]RSN58133.1 hypothetical protein DMH12_11300 [Streptomyces sp. WAC 04229]
MTASVTSGSAPVHPHVRILEAVYADLPRLVDFADAGIVLHPAHRGTDEGRVVRGRDAVLAHERALLQATGGSLVMDTERVVANDYFGAVLGTLRASRPRPFAMPFCGLWRFADGLIIEHWENAHAPHALQQLLAPARPAGTHE